MSTIDKPWYDVLGKFDQIAHSAIQAYPALLQSTVQLLNYSENATYLVKNTETDEKYILRVGRLGYNSKREIESELAWLLSIAEHSSIHVSLPILACDGEYIQEIVFENERYHCILFTFLAGDAPDENNEADLIKQFEALGEITAHLHEHSMNFRENLTTIQRLSWDYETIIGSNAKWGRWQDGLGMTKERIELFEKVSKQIKNRLEQFGKGPEHYGLIHSDLRLANLLVEGRQIKVIDFDDCGYSYYLYDLAGSLSFIEHKPYVPALIHAWLKGYRKVRALSIEEELEIPTFIMMRRLQLIAWIGSRDNDTTRELGSGFTVATDRLAREYLQHFAEVGAL